MLLFHSSLSGFYKDLRGGYLLGWNLAPSMREHQHWPGIGEEQDQSLGGGCSGGRGSLGLSGAALCVLLSDTSPSPCSWLTLDDHVLTRHTWPWVPLLLLTLQWESPGPEVLWSLLSRIILQTQGEDQSPHCCQLLLPHSQMFAYLLWFFFHMLGYHWCISSDRTLLSLKVHTTQTLFLSLDPLSSSLPHTRSHPPTPSFKINIMSTQDTIFPTIPFSI